MFDFPDILPIEYFFQQGFPKVALGKFFFRKDKDGKWQKYEEIQIKLRKVKLKKLKTCFVLLHPEGLVTEPLIFSHFLQLLY